MPTVNTSLKIDGFFPDDFHWLDLIYAERIKSLGDRQTFHPKNLEYDVFNIEIDIGPVNLLLHGLFLKKLWWVKVSDRCSSSTTDLLVFIKENLFGWDQVFHDLKEPDLIREKKLIIPEDPLMTDVDPDQPFDPRTFRPLMVTVRVALHNMTIHLLHVRRLLILILSEPLPSVAHRKRTLSNRILWTLMRGNDYGPGWN